MSEFFKKLIITATTILALSSCGAPSLDSDRYDHCIDHKFANDDYTCSRYHLIKPDSPKSKTGKKH